MPYTLEQTAQKLNIGRNILTKSLRKLGVFDTSNTPQGRYSGQGYFIVRQKFYKHPTRGDQAYNRTEVTEAGIKMLDSLLNKTEAGNRRAMQ